MTTINRQFTTPKGTTIDLVITIDNSLVGGSATFNGAAYPITNYTIVKGRKALALTGGSASFLPIPDSIYAEISAICSEHREQRWANRSALEIAEDAMRDAEDEYKRLFSQGYNNVAIIKARDEWDRLSAEYRNLRSAS